MSTSTIAQTIHDAVDIASQYPSYVSPAVAALEAREDRIKASLTEYALDRGLSQGDVDALFVSVGLSEPTPEPEPEPESESLGEGSVALEKIADILKRDFSGRRIYVEGHTDNDPINKTKDKYKDNLDLSAERAGAVARFLIEQGVPARQVSIVGYGQHDPLDAGTKARNRRVEIVPGEKF